VLPVVIFGIRRKSYRLATVFAVCGLCHTPAAQAVVRVRTFFSLFFVPVLPLANRYRTTCTMCGRSTTITREAAESLVIGAQAQTAPPRPLPPTPGSFRAPQPPAAGSAVLPAPGSAQPTDGGPPLA
jgi:hypothetical protein